jgi:hypothetical protein
VRVIGLAQRARMSRGSAIVSASTAAEPEGSGDRRQHAGALQAVVGIAVPVRGPKIENWAPSEEDRETVEQGSIGVSNAKDVCPARPRIPHPAHYLVWPGLVPASRRPSPFPDVHRATVLATVAQRWQMSLGQVA